MQGLYTDAEITRLRLLWMRGLPTREIAEALGRPYEGVQIKARKLGLPDRGIRRTSYWSPEQDEQLAELWAEGFSAGKIAEEMGKTRNSIIGRSRRLNLEARETIYRKARRYSRGSSRHHSARRRLPWMSRGEGRARQTPPTPVDAVPAPTSETNVTLLDRRTGQCAWPIGDTDGPETVMCGAAVTPGNSFQFCPYHTHQAQTVDRVGRKSVKNKKRGRLTAFQHENAAEVEA